MTVLVQDTYIRANTAGNTAIANVAGWGTASDGNTWAKSGGTPTWSILSNQGKVTNTSVDTYALLSANTYGTSEVLARITASVVNNGHIDGVLLRWASTASYYMAMFFNNVFFIVKNTTGSSLTSTAFTVTANQAFWIRFRAVGSTLTARIWLDGNTEPGSWTLTTTDSAHATGQVGVFVSPNANSDTIVFDNFQANDTVTLLSLATEARDTFKIRAQLASQTRDTFKVRALLATEARDAFKIRAALATEARATWKIKAALATLTRTTFKVRAQLASQARDTFKVKAALAAQARATFKVKAVLAVPTRAAFVIRARLATPARATFRLRASLKTLARAIFRIRVPMGPTPLTITVARGRDGRAVAHGRDGKVIARGRDGHVEGRSH